LRSFFNKLPNELSVSWSLNKNARTAETNLPLISKRGADASGNGRVEVRVREDDVRIFPAQFE
jgi:hypothetical protein